MASDRERVFKGQQWDIEAAAAAGEDNLAAAGRLEQPVGLFSENGLEKERQKRPLGPD